MQKVTNQPLKKSLACLKESIAARLYTQSQLQFVYDIVSPDTPFEKLTYVIDAARKPLSSTRRFFEVYGLHRTLFFKRAERRVSKPQNWWIVYQ